MRYRRANVPGGAYFFTVNLANRASRLLIEHVDVLRDAVRTVKQNHPFDIFAWSVMPEHMHAVWRMPERDADFSKRWMLIKQRFSWEIERRETITPSRKRKGERGIWQRRFWEHLITDEHDLARHIDYVHINPVKHGYVTRASDWPYSSLHRYIRQGLLPTDWACAPELVMRHGERS